MMNFISRVVGAHRLLLLPFYSHLQRYVASQQREVTHILAYMVQACHDLVPPDEVSHASYISLCHEGMFLWVCEVSHVS